LARIQPVRIGLVGYGKGGRFFHAPMITVAAGCGLAGVVTQSAERRGDLERDHPGTPAYDDLAQLASAGVDAVAISTPADTHVPLVLEAVSLGLPVVCDKPFALQTAAARQALKEAERAGVPLTVYQNRRFDADFLTVRAMIDSGELGRVTRFESRMEQYTPAGGIPASGGGILLDLGAHIVDQALLLFGPVISVYAELDDAGGRPGRFFIAMRHVSGVVSHLVGDLLLHGAPGSGSGCSAPWAAMTLTHSMARPTSSWPAAHRQPRAARGEWCRVSGGAASTSGTRPGPGPVNAGTGRSSTPRSPMQYADKVPCRSTPGTLWPALRYWKPHSTAPPPGKW